MRVPDGEWKFGGLGTPFYVGIGQGTRLFAHEEEARDPARTGAKPQGEIEKAINAARRALVSSMLENALEPAKVRALDAALRARLAREARTLRERIERISDALAGVKG